MIIDKINFKELEAEKYWSFPSSFKGNPKEEIKNMIFSGDYIGSEKKDGSYYRFIKDMDGNMVLQGRSRSVKGGFLNKIGHVPHLHEYFKSLPNGTCLLGEIYFPEKQGSNHVTTIMGCLEKKAIQRQEKGPKLHYYIFDIWAWEGKSLLKTNMLDRAEELISMQRAGYINEYVEIAQYFFGRQLWELLEKVFEANGEGIVMTKAYSVPEPGKRPARKTVKVKKELNQTIDCIFTGGYTPPTRRYEGKEIANWQYWEDLHSGEKKKGSYYKYYHLGDTIEPITKSYFYGWAGSLEIGLVKGNKVVPIGFLSGLTEEVRSKVKELKGIPIEVTAMEIMETGGLRHAKLVKFRPDLTIKDCTWEKVFG